MAYCCKCGKEIQDGLTYCPECEMIQTESDTSKNSENEDGNKETKKQGKISI